VKASEFVGRSNYRQNYSWTESREGSVRYRFEDFSLQDREDAGDATGTRARLGQAKVKGETREKGDAFERVIGEFKIRHEKNVIVGKGLNRRQQLQGP